MTSYTNTANTANSVITTTIPVLCEYILNTYDYYFTCTLLHQSPAGGDLVFRSVTTPS